MSSSLHHSRRSFIKKLGTAGVASLMVSCSAPTTPSAIPESSKIPTILPSPALETPTPGLISRPSLVIARGTDAAENTRRAIQALGGIEQFVKSGADVIIKPNICTDYYPYEYGATTNPSVVGALVGLCLGAGARRVRVMDNPFGGTAQSAYARSGIAQAVAAAGGEMEVMNRNKFKTTEIPQGKDIQSWIFYKDILDADVVINVPIAKHHNLTGVTLGCKNLLGTILNRGQIHPNIHQRIADLASRVRPSLTVVDAMRTLMANGPTGGNLNDVRVNDTIIASSDFVAADSYASTLFGLKGSDVGYIHLAGEMGLGSVDLNNVIIEELSL